MRGVVDVAMRGAKFWLLPPDDLHRRVFVAAHENHTLTWASRSLALLSRWGLCDFCLGAGSLESYRRYVLDTLECAHASVWKAAALRHRVSVPYRRIVEGVSDALACARASNLPWEQMKMQLSLSRLRSGIVPLGHLSRHRSAACVQQCMSCDAMVSNLWVHVFGTCPAWKHMRELAHRALALPPSCRSWDVVYAILGVHANSPAYSCCLVFVDAVVTAANSYKFREPGTQ